MDTFRIWNNNQLTLAGLWTLFGVVRPSVTNQQTLAGLWTLFGYEQKCPYTSWPWQVYIQCYRPADPGWSMDKKNVSFVYSIIHAKYILFMMCRHSPLTVKHLTRYHTTVLPLSPWHSLSSSPTPVSSPHFIPNIIKKSITENFSKTHLSLPHMADLEKAGSGGSSASRTFWVKYPLCKKDIITEIGFMVKGRHLVQGWTFSRICQASLGKSFPIF